MKVVFLFGFLFRTQAEALFQKILYKSLWYVSFKSFLLNMSPESFYIFDLVLVIFVYSVPLNNGYLEWQAEEQIWSIKKQHSLFPLFSLVPFLFLFFFSLFLLPPLLFPFLLFLSFFIFSYNIYKFMFSSIWVIFTSTFFSSKRQFHITLLSAKFLYSLILAWLFKGVHCLIWKKIEYMILSCSLALSQLILHN